MKKYSIFILIIVGCTTIGILCCYNKGLKEDIEGKFLPEEVSKVCEAAEQGDATAQNNLGLHYDNGLSLESDCAEAVRRYRAAAEQGHAQAQYKLGECYDNGFGVAQDCPEAIKWYRMAAEQGYAEAQFDLGMYYYFGGGVKQDNYRKAPWREEAMAWGDSHSDGVGQDYVEAVKWFRKAAEQGHAEAQSVLGLCYDHGYAVEQDKAEAVKWHRKAGEQGVTRSQYIVGMHYADGEGVGQDYVEAVKWFQKAAEQGYFKVQYILGLCYFFGYGVGQDYAEAVKWFRLAAEQGHADAQYILGCCYEFGSGVEINLEEAEKWYTEAYFREYTEFQTYLEACYKKGVRVVEKKDNVEMLKWFLKTAEQGDVVAQYYLGKRYSFDRGWPQDKVEAVKWYRLAAEQGFAMAQFNLGICYYCGEGVEQNYAEAVKWFRLAAEQEYAKAQNNLGVCYYKDEGVEQDFVEAVKWFRLAAEQGYADAQFNLGLSYANGEGVGQDFVEAVKWYRLAAEQGVPKAQFYLGGCFYDGKGVAPDKSEAVKWWRKAAEHRYAWAQCIMGSSYYSGDGVEQDYTQAIVWYRKAAAQGLAIAQRILGRIYFNGTDVEQDYSEAVRWWHQAAEQGEAVAQFYLGVCYYNGNGVEKDYSEAVKWYRESAKQGLADAQCWLGFCYDQGIYVPQNTAEAVKWYRKAADQGNTFAQIGLAEFYYKGDGVNQDFEEAVKWLQRAAEQGDVIAQNNLGDNLYYGMGVEKDYAEAVKWFRKAAEQGEFCAQRNLGRCYYHGHGVEQDYSKAAKWFRLAAEQEDACAQFNLGCCYERGHGVEQDAAEAEKWFRLSAEQEDALLRYSLSRRRFAAAPGEGYAEQDGNSFFQLRDTLEAIRGDEFQFDDIVKMLDAIAPRESRAGGSVVTADEMKLLLMAYKLDFAVAEGQTEEARRLLAETDSLLSSTQPDFQKLSGLYEDGIGMEALLKDITPARAMILADPALAVERIQASFGKYPEDGLERALLCYELGRARMKTGQVEQAVEQFEYAFGELEKHGIFSSLVAADLNASAAFSQMGGALSREQFSHISQKVSQNSASRQDPIAEALVRLGRAIDAADGEWDEEARRQFELDRSAILSNSTSDTRLFLAYSVSAIVRGSHGYPPADTLSDLEQALQYRALLWGDADAEDAQNGQLLRRIDSRLEELKGRLLETLAETGNMDRLAYWSERFGQSARRRAALDEAAEAHGQLRPLLEQVNRYINAEQILSDERAKSPDRRDKSQIRKAQETKRDLEQQFDEERKKLPPEELAVFNAFLADNIVVHPDSLGKLGAKLPPRVAFVQFMPVGEKLLAFFVVREFRRMLQIDLRERAGSARQFTRKLLTARSYLSFNAEPNATRRALGELYNILFADLEEPLARLGVDTLVVNATGLLRYIPFAALHDGTRYLVEKYQVTNVTGLDISPLSSSAAQRDYDSLSAVVFADPDGTLPSGRAEGEAVARLFGESQLFVGDGASLDEFESLIGEVNFIHLATHAVLDANSPEKSYILFANGQKWYYSSMMGFNVENVDSIALSACSSAVSERSTGGEIEGMAYQLLKKSPAASILASFWKVDDAATAEFMAAYYTHIVDSIKASGALDRGGALREAQLKLLANPATSHPYYWAAFTLFGDFR